MANIYKFPILNPVKFYSKDYYKDYPDSFISWKNTPDYLLNTLKHLPAVKFTQPFDEMFSFQVWVDGQDDWIIELIVDGVVFTDSTDTDHFSIQNITPTGAEIGTFQIFKVVISHILINDLKLANKTTCIDFVVDGKYWSNEMHVNESVDLLKVKYKETGFKQGMFFDDYYYIYLDKFQLNKFDFPFEDEDANTVHEETRLLKSFFSEKRSYQSKDLPTFYTQKLSYILGCNELYVNNISYTTKTDIKQNYKSFTFGIQTNEVELYDRYRDISNIRTPINNTLSFKPQLTATPDSFKDYRNVLNEDVTNDPGQNNNFSKGYNVVFHNESVNNVQIDSIIDLTSIIDLVDCGGVNYNNAITTTIIDVVNGWNIHNIAVDNSLLPLDTTLRIIADGDIFSEYFEVQNFNIIKYQNIGSFAYPTGYDGLSSALVSSTNFWIKNVQVLRDEYNRIDEDYNDTDEQSQLLYSNPKEVVTLKFSYVPSYLVLKLAMITTHEFTYNGQLMMRNGGFKIRHLGSGLNNLEFDCELFTFEEYEQTPDSNLANQWILSTGTWNDNGIWIDTGTWND